jgi:hypothetical protein
VRGHTTPGGLPWFKAVTLFSQSPDNGGKVMEPVERTEWDNAGSVCHTESHEMLPICPSPR